MTDVVIGGVEQRLWLRAWDVGNPAVILLHGGPGASETALFRHYNADLERRFLMVYWDQRGAGRSYRGRIPPESMTIDQFVRDLDEVVEFVRRRFRKDKVVLLGHSWGSAIGILYAARFAEKVSAYVGVGQVVDMREGERLSYEFARSEAAHRKHRGAIRALERIGPPPHTVDEMLTSRLISFKIPIMFLLGRYDRQVPAALATGYFDRIDAPAKRLVWFEQSAHNPPFEQPAQFNRTLVEVLQPFVYWDGRTSHATCQ